MNKKKIILFIAVFLILTFSVTAFADNKTQLNSNGRIEFDNRTPEDPSDDALFDAGDLLLLEQLVKEVEIKTATLEEALK